MHQVEDALLVDRYEHPRAAAKCSRGGGWGRRLEEVGDGWKRDNRDDEGGGRGPGMSRGVREDWRGKGEERTP